MQSDLRKPTPRDLWELAAALGVVGWRAWAYPLRGLWRDWVALLAVYWILALWGSRSRAWPYVSGAVMAGLLVLYGFGQLPLVVQAFGSRP